MQSASQNLKVQKIVATISVVLFLIKIIAWYLTDSVAILTDALESIVNVTAGFMGVYSLMVSAKPKDKDHPYGHGKVEFISASVEGTLIFVAGIYILYEVISNFNLNKRVTQLDIGLILVAASALINWIAGSKCQKIGEKNNSLALIASGKHLKTDTYTTIGIFVGLLLMYITGWMWIDKVVAIIFAFVILYTGVSILRSSIAGIMDAADEKLMESLIKTLQENRSINWVDLHNLRIIKYGAMLHVDCHLTVPWYFNVHEAHHEVDKLDQLVKEKYGNSVEMFVHSDGCLDFSCAICIKNDCSVRKHAFVKEVNWNFNNISSNNKHDVASIESK